MSNRPVNLLLSDILEAIDHVIQYIEGMSFESFSNDQKTIDAVVRNLEIIGEAANRLPDDFKEKHSQVEWHKVVGLRNRIIHDYFGIDLQIIWQIIHSDLPSLRQTLSRF
ncbi:MAG: DUF86 domain-containing protein [Sedimentisphaerales bacterium]